VTLPQVAKPVGAAALLGGRPVRTEQVKGAKHRVVVLLRDVFERDNQVFIRYAVRNGSKHPYDFGTPKVLAVNVHRSAPWLRRLSNAQLSEVKAAHLVSEGLAPVEVVDSETRSSRVGPGEETVAVVALELPSGSAPKVLRFVFPQDRARPVSATLVL
jgi:hypothetical protein